MGLLSALALSSTLSLGSAAGVATAQLPLQAQTQRMLSTMWSELEQHCSHGLCSIATGSRSDTSGFDRWVGKNDELENTTECKGRLLAYEYGLKIIPARAPQVESFDALELEGCGVTRPTAAAAQPVALSLPTAGVAFHVNYDNGDDAAAGDESNPYQSIHRALAATRAVRKASDAPKSIVLQEGVHYLNATIELTAADSGLTLTAAPGAEGKVTVSGGLKLTPTWTKSAKGPASANIWVTDVPELKGSAPLRGLTTLEPHRRVTRAREPNADEGTPGSGWEGAELCKRCWHGKVGL